MMVSTKGRYALRVMIDLAEHDDGLYIPLKEIAARQDISEKISGKHRKAAATRNGDLVGVRGKGGGYRLTRSPEEYTVGSILRLTEGGLAPRRLSRPGQPAARRRAEDCRTLPMWKELDRLINDYLDGVTLADLIHSHEEGPVPSLIRLPSTPRADHAQPGKRPPLCPAVFLSSVLVRIPLHPLSGSAAR